MTDDDLLYTWDEWMTYSMAQLLQSEIERAAPEKRPVLLGMMDEYMQTIQADLDADQPTTAAEAEFLAMKLPASFWRKRPESKQMIRLFKAISANPDTTIGPDEA